MKISDDGNTITMRAPDNWHAHFRQGFLLCFLVGIFIRFGWRRRVAAEPNTTPAKLTGEEAILYRDEIVAAAREVPGGETFEPVPIMQITESTTPEMVREAHARGVRIFKVYPFMVTTHSSNGVRHYPNIYPALAAAQEFNDTVVQFHGEDPDEDVEGMDKQKAFIKILEEIVRLFPRLRLTVEHVGSLEVIEWVKAQGENVAASITVHHIYGTMDDLMGYSKRSGGLMRVHDGCKPQPLRRRDRAAVQDVILSGHPRFFYGGDDAAHLKSKKECAGAACGVWNTMVALSLLISFFEKHNALHRLEPFLSEFGARFYGYSLNEETVTYVRKQWKVPDEVQVPSLKDSIVPMFAGETVEWELAE